MQLRSLLSLAAIPALLLTSCDSTLGTGTYLIAPTLTVNCNQLHGSVSITPNKASYTTGEKVILTASANPNYTFSNWSGGLSGTSAIDTIYMNGSQTVTASFTNNSGINLPQYTLTVSAPTNGAVVLSPLGGIYDSGTVVTLSATPATGYDFTAWTGVTGSSASTTVIMTGNKTAGATFTKQATGTASIVGTWSVDDMIMRSVRDSAGITSDNTDHVTAADLALVGSGITFNLYAGGTALMDLSGETASATWTYVGNKLTITSDEGPETFTVLSLTANATTWAVSYDTSYTENGSAILEQEFDTIQFKRGSAPVGGPFTLYTGTSGSGSVTKSPSLSSYPSGTSVTLTATPAAGYQFSNWSGDASGSTASITVSVTSNMEVTANFTATGTVPAIVGKWMWNSIESGGITAVTIAGSGNFYQFNADHSCIMSSDQDEWTFQGMAKTAVAVADTGTWTMIGSSVIMAAPDGSSSDTLTVAISGTAATFMYPADDMTINATKSTAAAPIAAAPALNSPFSALFKRRS